MSVVEIFPDPADDEYPPDPLKVGQGRHACGEERRWVTEILSDPAFRARSPHMHRKVVPLSALDALDTGIVPPTDPLELKLFNNRVAALAFEFTRFAVRDIVIAIPPNNILELRAGHFALYVARHLNEPVVLVRLKYDSAKTGGPFWIAAPENWYA